MEDKKYIPITWGDVGRFFLFLAVAGLAVLNFFLIIQSWKTLELGNLSEKQQYSFGQLAICWVLIGEYLLISSSAICLTAMLKKGFKNLKPVEEERLISGLIVWLIAGPYLGSDWGSCLGS